MKGRPMSTREAVRVGYPLNIFKIKYFGDCFVNIVFILSLKLISSYFHAQRSLQKLKKSILGGHMENNLKKIKKK